MSEHLNEGHDFANVPKFCWIFGGGGVRRDDYCRFTYLCEVKRQTIPRNNQDRLRSSLSSLSSLEAVGFPPFSFQLPLAFFPHSSARREGWGRLLVLCPQQHHSLTAGFQTFVPFAWKLWLLNRLPQTLMIILRSSWTVLLATTISQSFSLK